MNRRIRAFRPLVLGAWVLMTPPTPVGTALPPLSEWSAVSKHETPDDCERRKEAMRKAAKATAARDATATALDVADALGRLQSRCVEVKTREAEAPPAAAAPAVPPAGAPAAATSAASVAAPAK